MAAPRVFVSSTYYDLKQYRSNIADFIHGLGYEPIMHERQGVAYTQEHALETDCYHELESCDIAVCIIGNHFGSKSQENDLSITMNEIKKAIKRKMKVYIFIASDVYMENKTYRLNKDTGSFKSAFVDDIKIHEFIAELIDSVRNRYIAPFESTDQIINTLRAQFAGLFQNLLQRESSMTDAKTAYDLQESADRMKEIISDFETQKEEFFVKFNSSCLFHNRILYRIKSLLGMKESAFYATDINALDEFMQVVGFSVEDVDDPSNDARKYVRNGSGEMMTIILKQFVLNGDKTFKKTILKSEDLDKGIICSLRSRGTDELPF